VNSGVDYQANNPAIYDDWQVLSDVSLNIVSVTAAATRVTQGQDSLLVLLEVGNTGGVDAVIGSTDSLGIQFLANNNTVTLIGPTLPDTIGASFSEVYSFYVTVNTSAATGIDSLRGFAIGRNVRTGQTNNVTSSYLDGWDVQTPANIAITSVFNGFSQVNSGQQDLSVEIRLFNQGQATALLDSSDMFGIPGGFITDSLQLATFPDSIISGGRDTVLFNVDVSAAYTGQLELDASIDYRDGNDTTRALAASGAVNRHTWTVGSDGILVVDSVFSDVTTMSLGQSGVPVRAQISNVGSAAVQIDSLRMLFNGSDTHTVLSATRVQPATLPLLSTGQSFIAEFSLSAASLPLDSGVVVFDLAAFGTDQITLALIDTMSSEQTDSLDLQTPADVNVVSILNPSTVLRGENNVADTLIITNSGGATARISAVTLNFRNGNTFYNRELISPSLPFDINGYTTDTIAFEVDVLITSPLGVDSLAGQVQGIELNRGTAINTTSPYLSSWQVTGSGAVSILSVIADRSQISVAQDSMNVGVRINNQGSTTVRMDSLTLQFASGNSNYTVGAPVPALGFDLAAGGDTTFSIRVDENGTTPIGVDTIDARLVATEVLTSQPFIVTGAINTDTWLVQQRPSVVIDSVAVTPSLASAGQSNLTGRLVITNQAGVNRATARIENVDLNFLLGLVNVDTNFTSIRQTPPNLPFTLPQGESQAIDYSIGVNSNSIDTTFVVDGAISYTDINDDSLTSVISAIQADSLDVQSGASINILSLTMTPDTVSQSQSRITGTLIYENTGSASLNITSAQLSYAPPADFVTNLIGETTF
jgi:hypothetical protein